MDFLAARREWAQVHIHLVGRSVLWLWVSILPQAGFCDGFTNEVGQGLEMKAKRSLNHVGLPSAKLMWPLPANTLGLKPARLHSLDVSSGWQVDYFGPFPSWRHCGSSSLEWTLILDVGLPGLSTRIVFDQVIN